MVVNAAKPHMHGNIYIYTYLKKVGFFCMCSLLLLAYTWKKHLFFGRLYRDYHEIHVCIIYIYNIIVPTCASVPFLLIPTIPIGTCWGGITKKGPNNGMVLQFLGIQLVSSYEVGPVTSYKWNYIGSL